MKVEINGRSIEINEDATILKACEKAGVAIPTLCYHKDLGSQKVCGICVVEADGKFVKSCETQVREDMKVTTHSDKVMGIRKNILKSMMAEHPNDCLTCEKSKGDCELQNICYEYGIENRNKNLERKYEIDRSTPGMVRDMNKCILCEKCVAVCRDVQKLEVYKVEGSHRDRKILLSKGSNLSEGDCINCGQCIKVCPVGALTEKNNVVELNQMLKRRDKHLIVQMAPAIKHTIGEEFFIGPGEDASGKMVEALRLLGFEKIYSTDYSADVTIMEEGTELLERLIEGKGKLPMFTSCCPGWINYVEGNYPEFLDNLSSCKSPQQIFGALAKSYYAESADIPKEDVYVVSIMPCTAKKGEAERPQMPEDVDMVITTREFAKLLRMNKIDFSSLEGRDDYDSFMGKGSSAGRIFGTSGGVMEAALRTVAAVIGGDDIGVLEFREIRGFDNVKETHVELGEYSVKLAVVNGIASVGPVLDAIKRGEVHYDFIEVMACHGGCISGGGAPIPDNMDVRKKRMEGMYAFDGGNDLRRSHDNPEVKRLYEDYLKDPCGHKSHHLLHTSYTHKKKQGV